MDELIEPLTGQRQPKETKRAVQSCNDYLLMGAGRSLEKLWQRYQAVTDPLPPTRRITTLKQWSTDYGWVARADEYDAKVEAEKTALVEARRRDAIDTGLALDYERILKLKHLADTLGREIWSDDGKFIKDAIWLPDVKQIGGGEYAERVDLVKFNQAILTEFRAILDDLAKETGGRKSRQEVTGADGGPIQFTQIEVQLNRNEPVED